VLPSYLRDCRPRSVGGDAGPVSDPFRCHQVLPLGKRRADARQARPISKDPTTGIHAHLARGRLKELAPMAATSGRALICGFFMSRCRHSSRGQPPNDRQHLPRSRVEQLPVTPQPVEPRHFGSWPKRKAAEHGSPAPEWAFAWRRWSRVRSPRNNATLCASILLPHEAPLEARGNVGAKMQAMAERTKGFLARPKRGADYTTNPQYFLKNLPCLPSA
jgi:hypothetical protein